MIIDFQVIPHRKQRYPTVGDYFRKKGRWFFRISKMQDQRYSVLVFLHEVIEFLLCRTLGISMKEIDRFDIEYEKLRPKGITPCGCNPREEPGDDPHAPYFKAHQVATQCEKIIAESLGVRWSDYEGTIESL